MIFWHRLPSERARIECAVSHGAITIGDAAARATHASAGTRPLRWFRGGERAGGDGVRFRLGGAGAGSEVMR